MSQSENRTCQNCKASFEIDTSDFAFYEKIFVPPPTWCPECRMRRRMIFRNERSLYKDQCDSCGKSIISMYSPDKPFKVYCHDCWWSDKWDGIQYGREYDFSKSFFEQFRQLLLAVPRLALEGYQNQNSPYTNFTWFSKDVYMSPSTLYAENVSFSHKAWHVRDVFDSNGITKSELCYESIDTDRSVRSAYLQDSRDCLDSYFLYDCANCKTCFMSSNLRNKSYVFRNEQLDKSEYEKKLKEVKLSSFRNIEALKKEFLELKTKALHRFAVTNKVLNVSGNNILNSKNIRCSFNIVDSENLIYCTQSIGIKDCVDVHGAGDGGELAYEGINVALNDSRVLFSSNTFENIVSASYCDYCRVGSNLFGCVGLRKKHYCILNKEYSKEKYEKLVPKIITHMNDNPYVDKKGNVYKYGEFSPMELSPFCYNEPIIQEYFPLSKEQAAQKGYKWHDREPRNYDVLVRPDDLPDDISEVSDDVLDKPIECAHGGSCMDQCTIAFKITPAELQFLKRMNLPLPRMCPNCRHYERLRQKTPFKLWKRQCMCAGQVSDVKGQVSYKNTTSHFHREGKCPNKLETSYAPDRPEIVYCEQCYNAEVV